MQRGGGLIVVLASRHHRVSGEPWLVLRILFTIGNEWSPESRWAGSLMRTATGNNGHTTGNNGHTTGNNGNSAETTETRLETTGNNWKQRKQLVSRLETTETTETTGITTGNILSKFCKTKIKYSS